MSFDNFTTAFRQVISDYRKLHGKTLYQLAMDIDMSYDQLQKIESGKYARLEIGTYSKILKGMELGLSFNTLKKKKLQVSPQLKEFSHQLFLDLPRDTNYEYLNNRLDLLLGHLGKRVGDVRVKRGLTQSQLADRAGVSRFTLVRLESGNKSFKLETLYKISKVLNEKEIK